MMNRVSLIFIALLLSIIFTFLLRPVFDIIDQPETKDLSVYIKIEKDKNKYVLSIEENITYRVFPDSFYREFYREFSGNVTPEYGRCLDKKCLVNLSSKEISLAALDGFGPGDHRIQYGYKYITDSIDGYLLYDELVKHQGIEIIIDGERNCKILAPDLYLITPVSVEIDFEKCRLITFPVPDFILQRNLLLTLFIFPFVILLIKLLYFKSVVTPLREISLSPIDVAYAIGNFETIAYIRYLELKKERKIDERFDMSNLSELDKKMMTLVKYNYELYDKSNKEIEHINAYSILKDIKQNIDVKTKNHELLPLLFPSGESLLIFLGVIIYVFEYSKIEEIMFILRYNIDIYNVLGALIYLINLFCVFFSYKILALIFGEALFKGKQNNLFLKIIGVIIVILILISVFIYGLTVFAKTLAILPIILCIIFTFIIIFDREAVPYLRIGIDQLNNRINQEILGMYKFIFDFTNIPSYNVEQGKVLYDRLYEYALALDIPEDVMEKLRTKLNIPQDKYIMAKGYAIRTRSSSSSSGRGGSLGGSYGGFRGGGGRVGRR